MFARVIYPVVDRGNSVPVLFNKRSARMFGPLPVPGKGVGGRKRDNPRRGEVHTEGKTWRGGLWIFQRRTCCVVAGCHRHDYPNKLYRYQGGGEGEARLAPIIVKSNLEPWLAARFLLLYLNFSFHSCAGIILRRDVEGGGREDSPS